MAQHLSHSYPEGPYTPEQRAEDFREHDRTFSLFIKLFKWSAGITAVILIGLYIFLVA